MRLILAIPTPESETPDVATLSALVDVLYHHLPASCSATLELNAREKRHFNELLQTAVRRDARAPLGVTVGERTLDSPVHVERPPVEVDAERRSRMYFDRPGWSVPMVPRRDLDPTGTTVTA